MSDLRANHPTQALANLETLPDIVTRQVPIRPSKTALIFEGASLTYKELDDGSNRTANGLIKWGVKPGDRVGYLGKNSHHYYELLFGVAKAGAVLCPINWRLALPEIEYILNDFKPRILFVGIEFIDKVEPIRAAIESIEHVVPMEDSDLPEMPYATWQQEHPTTPTGIRRKPSDDALQMYTSGTTGHPKGAILSNGSILTAYERFRNRPNPNWNVWNDQDVSLIPMPCFHIGGTAWGLTTMAHGATGVVMRNFVPTDVLGYIDKFKISKLFLVPAALQIVANQEGIEDVDFSQLKFIFYGAAPMPLPLLEQSINTFGCGFAQFYGMTETSGTICALPPEDHDIKGNERMSSVGKALPDITIKIWDDNGAELPSGEIGEIVTRSSMNMNGYWNLPDATLATLTDAGWLQTGDMGYLDADGYLFLKDRKKDMIISGGENIYPKEIEIVLFAHPSVAEAAVIGIPDEKWGEAVKACVVLKPGKVATETEMIDWTRERLAKFKCPKSVDFIEALPRNPSGKVLKRELRAAYQDNSQVQDTQ